MEYITRTPTLRLSPSPKAPCLLLPRASILRSCQLELRIMVNEPIVRDFAFIKSSVPFPATNHSQTGTPPEHNRQRTGSNSSSSSSPGVAHHQSHARGTSMSGRTQKQLSPVAEEFEGEPGRRRLTSTSPRIRSRASHRTKPRPTSFIGQTGIMAEDLTIAMMSIIPPSPPRHHRKATERRGAMSKTRSSLHNLRLSIRARLPTVRLGRVLKRPWKV